MDTRGGERSRTRNRCWASSDGDETSRIYSLEAGLWVDNSERRTLMTSGDNPTIASKNGVNFRVADAYNKGVDCAYDEDVLVGACVVAVLML